MFRPNREFQAGLNPKEARRQRAANSLRLRRKDRELKLQNKRKKILNKNNPNPNPNPNHPNSPSLISLTNSGSISKLLSNLNKYVSGCYKNHPATILECCQMIRQLTAYEDMPLENIQKVINSGVIPRIIQLLTFNNYTNIQFEALWILTNIASTSSNKFTNIIVEKGVIQSCYQIIKIQKYPLQEQAIWTLGNILGESSELRDVVIKTGILQLLIQICKTPFNENSFWDHENGLSNGQQQYVQLFNTCSWMLSNACRYRLKNEECKLTILECIYHLIQIKNQITMEQRSEIALNISWALQYLTMFEDFSCVNKILIRMNKEGITKELINLISGPPKVSRPAVKTIGNILTGDDSYAQICLNFDVLKQFHNLFINAMQRNDTVMLRELCWCVSNITACENIAFTKKVIAANIFPMLCELLNTSSYLVSKEALWSVANAMQSCYLNERIMNYLCDENECDFIKYLCHFNKKIFQMEKNYANEMVLIVSLECIEHILACDKDLINKQYATLFEEYGGVDFLEFMQTVEISDDTYTKIVNIIQTYFGENDEINNNFHENGNNKIDDVSFNMNDNNNKRFSNNFGFGLNTNNSNGNDTFNF